jgi:hypothetical protein
MNEVTDKLRQPTPLIKDTRFKPGHPHYPAKQLSIRQQRQRHARMIADMLAKMAAAQAAGESIDANAAVRLVNTYNRLLAEL